MLILCLLFLVLASSLALPPTNYVYGAATASSATESSYYGSGSVLLRWDTTLSTVSILGAMPNLAGWIGMQATTGQLYACADLGYL